MSSNTDTSALTDTEWLSACQPVGHAWAVSAGTQWQIPLVFKFDVAAAMLTSADEDAHSIARHLTLPRGDC